MGERIKNTKPQVAYVCKGLGVIFPIPFRRKSYETADRASQPTNPLASALDHAQSPKHGRFWSIFP